ncbi:hypothetical protein F4781DRAFT_206231 [Annulohypoxylon bovei var. microspora]|nr:hypothetical protein F4781DRAFT_206231 [Annulohypoxylon bovei var. microspora]
MRPFTLIIALSATVLALPQPLPAAVDDASSAIIDGLNSGLNGVIGSPDHRHQDGQAEHASGCHYRYREDIAICINECVDQCVVDPQGCQSCMRGCSTQHGCEPHHHHHHHDGKKKDHGRPARREGDSNLDDDDEVSE